MRHGELAACLTAVDMRTWLVLERIYCTCERHPALKDPECRFCREH